MMDWPEDVLDALWGGVRTIAMTPDPAFGYDPIPLIRAGEKTHTVRGNPRRVGSIAQVWVSTGKSGRRIPLWLRFTGWESIDHERMMTCEFAYADGFRETQQQFFRYDPQENLWAFMAEHCPSAEQHTVCEPRCASCPHPTGRLRDRYLLHFEVIRDEMGGR
jgi:hypothetical protein